MIVKNPLTPPTGLAPPTLPGPPRFTRDEYMQLSEHPVIANRRVQLIGGELVEMPGQKNTGFAAIARVQRLLEAAFGPGYWVRNQGTLDLSPYGVPDPDLAVIVGDPDNPTDDNPSTALLVVEVSDSTLSYDRNAKASMYAAAAIADYWIVNVPGGQLEIRRDPQPDATQEFGYGYASLTTHKPGTTASLLALPGAAVPVDRLFV
ncbi:MAG: Uma2 family endonuclease [Gemmataceae bacterium]|nr:Uma2 family endonuclease [Gemmataceae bacterium]